MRGTGMGEMGAHFPLTHEPHVCSSLLAGSWAFGGDMRLVSVFWIMGGGWADEGAVGYITSWSSGARLLTRRCAVTGSRFDATADASDASRITAIFESLPISLI